MCPVAWVISQTRQRVKACPSAASQHEMCVRHPRYVKELPPKLRNNLAAAMKTLPPPIQSPARRLPTSPPTRATKKAELESRLRGRFEAFASQTPVRSLQWLRRRPRRTAHS